MKKTIVKYQNRKLYDKDMYKYINLSNILEYYDLDVDMVVIDKKTGNDITHQTVLQAVHKKAGKDKGLMLKLLNAYVS